MSKKYRGKGLIHLPSRGRGTCPMCNNKRVKLLYETIQLNGERLTVCKRCQHKRK